MKTKNKTAEQRAAKKEHKENLKKKRRAETILERNKPSLNEKPTLLIVCEGKKTEPTYFNQFRIPSLTLKTVGEGYNTLSLVKRAIQLAAQSKFDQVWCVFDKDDFDGQDFNQAIQLAESKGFGVAYSNQSFEYWLLLHLDDHQGGRLHRQEYHPKINALLKPFGLKYDGQKSKEITVELFELLDGIDPKFKKSRKELAILRAERIYHQQSHANPAREESSTTVFRLVKELLKHI